VKGVTDAARTVEYRQQQQAASAGRIAITMADETPTTRITKDDVEAVAGKLESFIADLPEQERDVLGWVLTRAEAVSTDDTAGYFQSLGQVTPLAGYSSPLSAQLGKSAGFGAAAGTTEVSWKYSFGKADLGGAQYQRF